VLGIHVVFLWQDFHILRSLTKFGLRSCPLTYLISPKLYGYILVPLYFIRWLFKFWPWNLTYFRENIPSSKVVHFCLSHDNIENILGNLHVNINSVNIIGYQSLKPLNYRICLIYNRNRAVWLIGLAYSLPAGVYEVWGAVIDVILKPVGIRQVRRSQCLR
jgi:hypothetical protein